MDWTNLTVPTLKSRLAICSKLRRSANCVVALPELDRPWLMVSKKPSNEWSGEVKWIRW